MIEPAENPVRNAGSNGEAIGSIALAITRLARTHGITAERYPIDDFADAVSRLSDAEVTLDPIERLLVNLRGPVSWMAASVSPCTRPICARARRLRR